MSLSLLPREQEKKNDSKHHKLEEHTPIAAQDNLKLSKFNTTIINNKKEEITKLTDETKALLEKYIAEDGDYYQLTALLMCDTNGGK